METLLLTLTLLALAVGFGSKAGSALVAWSLKSQAREAERSGDDEKQERRTGKRD